MTYQLYLNFLLGGILICMSIELCILYIIGRGINPQVRSVMIMLPNMIIWGIAYAAINIFSDKLSSAKGIFSNFEMLGNIVLIVSLIFLYCFYVCIDIYSKEKGFSIKFTVQICNINN